MFITWHGHSCFKITGTSGGEDVVIAMNPYSAESGLRPVRFDAQIVTLSNPHSSELDHTSIPSEHFLVDKPGEYEVKKVYIEGVSAYADKNKGQDRGFTNAFRINFEDVNIVHLGHLGSDLTDEQVQKFEACDVLLLPVGNKDLLTLKETQSVISRLEPIIIIPMLYKIPEITYDYGTLDAFIKEMGVKREESVSKLKINKKDLLIGETKVVILEKS